VGTYNQKHTIEQVEEFASKVANAEAIADQVVPVSGRHRKLVSFPKFDERTAFQIADTRVAPDGMSNQRKFDVTFQEMEVEPYALHDKIPISDLNDPEPGIDLEMDTIEQLTNDLIVDREKRIADMLMTAANYPASNKVTLSTPFTDTTASTPIQVIQTAKRACLMPPNIAVCDEVTFDALAAHPDIVAFLRGIGGATNGLASAEELARYFGLEKWLVGRMKYDTANSGQSASLSYIWPQGRLLLARTTPNPGQKSAVLARTLRYLGEGERGVRVTVEVDKKPGTDGVLFCKVAHEEVTDFVSTKLGYLISGAA
jgi:hypothetical protein